MSASKHIPFWDFSIRISLAAGCLGETASGGTASNLPVFYAQMTAFEAIQKLEILLRLGFLNSHKSLIRFRKIPSKFKPEYA